jgi:hypothetical protein
MNGSLKIKASSSLREDFAGCSGARQSGQRKKRMAPLSVRLSPEERTRLEALAGKQPIGAFVKSRMFAANDNIPLQPYGRSPVHERKELARILGFLARMDIFLILKELLKAMGNGHIQLKPEIESALNTAFLDLREIRCLLIEALGKKAK